MNLRGALFGLLSFCLLTPTVSVIAQTTPARPDSAVVNPTNTTNRDRNRIIKTEKDKGLSRPGRAALYSAVIPGAGQVYNQQYWKVPIIYAIGGALGYFIIDNNSQYQDYRQAYRYSIDTDPNTVPLVKIDGKMVTPNTATLQTGRDFYRRNRDLTIIIAALAYGLNIMEANVAAHLRGFDVSDDLSLNWQPNLIHISQAGMVPAPGLTFNLRFRSR